MPEDPQLPNAPSDEEIEAKLRRAVERAFAASANQEEDENDDPFLKLRADMAGDGLPDLSDDPLPKRPPLPEDDPEFAQRLESLHSRAEKVKTVREASFSETKRQQTKDQSDSRGLGLGLSIAYTLLGLPVVLALVGWAIDVRIGTTVWRGILAMLGMIIGIANAVVLTNRANGKK